MSIRKKTPDKFRNFESRAHSVKSPEVIIQESYFRVERLLHLNEQKLKESVQIQADGSLTIDLAARDLRVLQQNIQDLQQELKLYAETLEVYEQKSKAAPPHLTNQDSILNTLFGDLLNTAAAEEEEV